MDNLSKDRPPLKPPSTSLESGKCPKGRAHSIKSLGTHAEERGRLLSLATNKNSAPHGPKSAMPQQTCVSLCTSLPMTQILGLAPALAALKFSLAASQLSTFHQAAGRGAPQHSIKSVASSLCLTTMQFSCRRQLSGGLGAHMCNMGCAAADFPSPHSLL